MRALRRRLGPPDQRPVLVQVTVWLSWWARFDEPAARGKKRQQPRIGPYATKREAQAALTEVLKKVNSGDYRPVDRSVTIEVDLTR